jgi:hypothetical protein
MMVKVLIKAANIGDTNGTNNQENKDWVKIIKKRT